MWVPVLHEIARGAEAVEQQLAALGVGAAPAHAAKVVFVRFEGEGEGTRLVQLLPHRTAGFAVNAARSLGGLSPRWGSAHLAPAIETCAPGTWRRGAGIAADAEVPPGTCLVARWAAAGAAAGV